MFRLEDLALFVRAAALSSFSDAAREAGLQPAQVSAAIKRLETTLNIRLFARSTRSLRLTPEGETWLPYATQMLDTLHAGLQKISTPDDEVRGTLQIAVPSDLGRNLLLRVFPPDAGGLARLDSRTRRTEDAGRFGPAQCADLRAARQGVRSLAAEPGREGPLRAGCRRYRER